MTTSKHSVEPTEPTATATPGAPPAEPGGVALRLESIHKSYPGVHALKDVSLSVRRGEVHAIVGENGAGKSTLVGVAAGTIVADSGTVEIDGEASHAPSPRWSRDRGLAIVYQEPALLPDLTVAENMRLGMPERRRPSAAEQHAWTAARLAAWRDAADIDPRTHVRDLRPDERFVVEIARALAEEPSILILDEPTEHLLPEGVEVLFAAIREELERGVAVVYISHRIREVKQVAHTISVLRDGASQGTHAAAEVSEEDIVDLIVGRRLETRFPDKPDAATFGEPLLRVEDFSGPRFHSVSLEVRRGEIVGLAGIDGHGQREFMRGLAGLASTHGRVSVAGEPVRLRSSASARQAGFGYLPNDRHSEGLLPGLNVRENLTLRALPDFAAGGIVRPAAERRATDRAVADYGIKTPSVESDVEQLSGGNQQKVMLSRIMMSSPPVILADEPTQGVDVGARADIYRLLRQAASEGSCVLVVSSDASELEGLCDRVVVFSRGAIVGELSGQEVTEHRIMRAALTATSDRYRDADRRGWNAPLVRFAQKDIAPSLVLIVAIVILGIIATAHNEFYFTTRNFGLMLPLVATMAFIALGQQLVMMLGGIDLSVGPLAGLVVVVASFVLTPAETASGLVVGWVIVLGVALAVGLTNWMLIAVVGISPLIATLVTFMGIQGISLLLREVPGGAFAPDVIDAVESSIGFVPVAMILVVLVAVALEVSLYRSLFGIRLRGLGSKPLVAQKVGVRARRIALYAYVGSALFAFVGALLLMPQVGSGNAAAGTTYTLTSIAAVVLGGASIFGGRGSFTGAVLGAALIVQITTVVQFLELVDYWQQYVLGALTIIAAAFYSKARVVQVKE